jgi:hypothetical protein
MAELASYSAYHPRPAGGGQALKIEAAPGRVKAGKWKAPGLFVQLAAQAGKLTPGAGAPFDWANAPRVMLAERDVAALRFAYDLVVRRGLALPAEMRPPNDTDGLTCSLVHRGASGVVLLHWSFTGQENRSFVRVTHPQYGKQAIALSEFEGFQLVCWLEVAHTWLLGQARPWRAVEESADGGEP